MKKLFMVFAAVWIAVSGSAQITADIGIWGGTSMYFGDLKETKRLDPFNPNFGGYFRYNFNARVGLRAQFLTGNFSDKGIIEGEEWEFEKTVQDFSLQVEVDFLKYILGVDKTPFTTYVMAGIGVAFYPYDLDTTGLRIYDQFNPRNNKGSQEISESVVTATIPFGVGFKYSLGSRLGIGIEYQMRKMFFDKLDNLDDPLAYRTLNQEGIPEDVTYTSAIHNNDWSAYLGVHITYKIYMGRRPCPAYESKN
jgi:hypothetical protein